MKAYEDFLKKKQFSITYIPAIEEHSDIRLLIGALKAKNISTVKLYDPCDDWLEKRIRSACANHRIEMEFLENPLFINSKQELSTYQDKKKKYHQTDFYIAQRKQRNILLTETSEPVQGKWTFDTDNRLKYPTGKKVPRPDKTGASEYHLEAAVYVEKYFSGNPGEIDPDFYYPVSHAGVEKAMQSFFRERFHEFGSYEDAIVKESMHLHHSVLSVCINTGLLLPGRVIHESIQYAADKKVPYNSLEGFVRQILGWREFIRMIYIREGRKQRTTNYWGFTRKIPGSFYTGNTGIPPIDNTINKLKRSGYNHHIERLMILSNFMLLCEFDPDEVYKWFMEMYIDAYDWVMVPNVYGMGQFADGGLMSTKPYISSSNYLYKMSNYQKGEPWAEIWDALFWRFMHVHRSFFLQNPRLGMLIRTFDKWEDSKKNTMLAKAETFLQTIDNETKQIES